MKKHSLFLIVPIIALVYAAPVSAEIKANASVTTGAQIEATAMPYGHDDEEKGNDDGEVKATMQAHLEERGEAAESEDGRMYKSEMTDEIEVEGGLQADGEMHANGLGISVHVQNKNMEETQVRMSNEVMTNEDLNMFAQSVSVRNQAIERVEANDDGVEVAYKEQVRLFGFIPMTITNKARVELRTNAEGQVTAQAKIQASFLRFLSKAEGSTDGLAQAIQSRLNAALQTQTQLSANVYAKALEALDLSVGVDASAEADAEIQ